MARLAGRRGAWGALLATLLGFTWLSAGSQLENTAAAQDGDKPVMKVFAWIAPPAQGRGPLLVVQCELDEGWHIYSLTQPKGGPARTKIKLKGDFARSELDFTANPRPQVHYSDDFQCEVEEHSGRVMWYAPLKLPGGADLSRLTIDGSVFAQACSQNSCLAPEDFAFSARLRRSN